MATIKNVDIHSIMNMNMNVAGVICVVVAAPHASRDRAKSPLWLHSHRCVGVGRCRYRCGVWGVGCGRGCRYV